MDRNPVHHVVSAVLACIALVSACSAEAGPPPSRGDKPSDAATPSVDASTPSAAASLTPSEAALAENTLERRTEALVPMLGGPDMPTEAFGSIWVVAVDGPLRDDGTDPAVHRIDAETNEVVASVPLPGRVCQGIGASPEAVWVCGPDGVMRIDPATNEIVATIPMAAPLVVSRLAYGAGSLWAFGTAAIEADTVVRIDPTTNEIVSTIPLGHNAATLAFGAGALWVSSAADDLLLRIDPETEMVAEWATGIEGAGWLAVSDELIWVTTYWDDRGSVDASEPSVVVVSPEDGAIVGDIVTGGHPGFVGVVADADGAWVRASSPFLVRVDAATLEVVDRIEAREGGGDVTVAFGSIWATAEDGDLWRISADGT